MTAIKLRTEILKEDLVDISDMEMSLANWTSDTD